VDLIIKNLINVLLEINEWSILQWNNSSYFLYEEKYELIDRCLENIKDFNIIIIDNAGNKKLRDQIKRKYTILDYILNSKNLGYSKAVNQGINLSESKYVFVFKDDFVMY
jgi:glycosyltransferase involved in cell wall biosynthesis